MSSAKCWFMVMTAVAVVLSAGCSEGPAVDTVAFDATSVSGPDAADVASSVSTEQVILTMEQVPGGFRDLATSMAGTPVFAVRDLPESVVVSDRWWPVIEGYAAQHTQQSDANPRVEGQSGQEPEGQLVLSCGDGWLVVIENFRGDLGDVSGEVVGSVAGHSAYQYEVNGGCLVQWEFEGRWYGVFGRDVEAEAVRSLALAMVLMEGH